MHTRMYGFIVSLLLLLSSTMMFSQISLQVENQGIVLFGDDTTNNTSKLLWIPSKRAFRAGYAGEDWQLANVGESSAAMGSFTKAAEIGSFAMGKFSTATGEYSIAIGNNCNATQDYAIALGNAANATASQAVAIGNNSANGFYSFASGLTSSADGVGSVAMGFGVEADALGTFAVGRYNKTGGTPNAVVATDPLFVVGNGMDAGSRSNAFEVKQNGQLHAPSLNDIGSMKTMQYNTTTGEIGYDNSSRRFKSKITTLEDEWHQLLKVRPVMYTRPRSPDFWEVGYIAEEVDSLGLTKLVGYDQTGRPDDVKYERIVLYLTEIIKDQSTDLKALFEEVESLKKTSQRQAEEINELRKKRPKKLRKGGGP